MDRHHMPVGTIDYVYILKMKKKSDIKIKLCSKLCNRYLHLSN